MRSSTYLFSFSVLVIILIGGGCSGTYDTTKKSELQQLRGKGPIRVLTVDSLLYTFETFSFTDSILSGQGILKRNGFVTQFEGSVPFRRIAFIERIEISYWKPVWMIPMLAGIISSFKTMLEGSTSTKFEIHRSGSCPFVYAYDGKEFKLEAEAFGTSISKAFEAQTFSLLTFLTPINGLLTVQVRNERPETHLLNSVQLFAADAGIASATVLDINNKLWPVHDANPPSAAHDHSGKDILPDIRRKDGRYWKSDLAHIAPFSGFRDQLELQFDLPQGASDATLIIHAVNTDLITEAYRSVSTILGDATMEFYHALEQDSQLQSEIREWIRECGLRIEVEHGTIWEEAGIMTPEANVAPFSRAVRISNLKSFQSPLHVRLSSLTDVWRIDAASIDFSPVQPLSMHSLEMISVNSSDKNNWENAIKSNDSSYALILPPNYISIQFDSVPVLKMQKPVYILATQGYLYEWFPKPKESSENLIANEMPSGDRVAMLKLIIQQKDLFLPPIYARWQSGTEENVEK
jgi:hypothetical protein